MLKCSNVTIRNLTYFVFIRSQMVPFPEPGPPITKIMIGFVDVVDVCVVGAISMILLLVVVVVVIVIVSSLLDNGKN